MKSFIIETLTKNYENENTNKASEAIGFDPDNVRQVCGRQQDAIIAGAKDVSKPGEWVDASISEHTQLFMCGEYKVGRKNVL